jgi:hypothetical protein
MTRIRAVVVSTFIVVTITVTLITVSAMANSIMGSRHDLTSFNQRGYASDVGPMTGTAFNNYKEVCVYCHTPHNADSIAPLWNRQSSNASGFKMYNSPNFDSKADAGVPDGISLACLSCHDGTVAVDAVLNQPKAREVIDTRVHYKMNDGQNTPGGDACGKCHNRGGGAYGGLNGAHDATMRYLSQDLTNDHPISIALPTYDLDPGFNQPSMPTRDGGRQFQNGIRTFAGDKVQCASCHNPHDPDERNAEGRAPFLRTSNGYSALCLTCHQK